ncbi:MAG: hypothetical protein KAH95_07770 [Spirochaetales bacterium]|nr:hypothetical protein [Spirochaetales bacterium]
MKQIFVLLSMLVFLIILSTSAFAHHPAADMVDPDVYAMIEENISDVHLDMTFDDMGGDTSLKGRTRASIAIDSGNAGDTTGDEVEDVGAQLDGDVDNDAATEIRQEANEMADSEPSGPMSAQR